MGNYGHFTWRIKYVFGCFSVCVGGIFLKIHTSPFTRICYKWSNFGGARSLFKGTLPRGHCVFSGVSWLAIEGISWKFTCHTPLMRWKWCNCDCYQSLTYRTLLEKKKEYFSGVSHLPYEWLSWNSIHCTLHACVTNGASLVLIGH